MAWEIACHPGTLATRSAVCGRPRSVHQAQTTSHDRTATPHAPLVAAV